MNQRIGRRMNGFASEASTNAFCEKHTTTSYWRALRASCAAAETEPGTARTQAHAIRPRAAPCRHRRASGCTEQPMPASRQQLLERAVREQQHFRRAVHAARDRDHLEFRATRIAGMRDEQTPSCALLRGESCRVDQNP